MKNTFILLHLLLSIFVANKNATGQKIPSKQKDELFKTAEHWQQTASENLKYAPTQILEVINSFNKEAAVKGYSFQIGYTSVWDQPLEKIT